MSINYDKQKITRKKRSSHDKQILETTFDKIKIPSNILLNELHYKLEGEWTIKEIRKWFNNRRMNSKKKKLTPFISNINIIHKKKRLVTNDYEKNILIDTYYENKLLDENSIIFIQELLGWSRKRIIQYRTNLNKFI